MINPKNIWYKVVSHHGQLKLLPGVAEFRSYRQSLLYLVISYIIKRKAMGEKVVFLLSEKGCKKNLLHHREVQSIAQLLLLDIYEMESNNSHKSTRNPSSLTVVRERLWLATNVQI